MLHAVGSGTFNAVILQDLATGDGASLEKGSSVEIVHTGWLLQDYNYGQVNVVFLFEDFCHFSVNDYSIASLQYVYNFIETKFCIHIIFVRLVMIASSIFYNCCLRHFIASFLCLNFFELRLSVIKNLGNYLNFTYLH